MSKNRIEEKFPPYFAIIVPLIFVLIWQYSSPLAFNFDASDYMKNGFIIDMNFRTRDFFPALWANYEQRMWKPIFFPFISWPFIFLTKGHVFFALKFSIVTFYGLKLIFIYKLFHLFLKKIEASFATLCMGFSFYIFNMQKTYMMELYFSTLALAFLFFYGRYIQSLHHQSLALKTSLICGLLLGVLGMINPALTLVYLGIPLCLYRCCVLNENKLAIIKNWVQCLFMGLPLIFAYLQSYFMKENLSWNHCFYYWMLLVLSIGMILWMNKDQYHSLGFTQLKIFMIAYLMVTLWYLPYLFDLHLWIEMSTYSPLSSEVAKRFAAAAKNNSLTISMQFKILLLSLLMSLFFILPRIVKWRHFWREIPIFSKLLLLGFFIPTLVFFRTHNPEIRNLYLALNLLSLLCLTFIMNVRLPMLKYSFVTLASLIIVYDIRPMLEPLQNYIYIESPFFLELKKKIHQTSGHELLPTLRPSHTQIGIINLTGPKGQMDGPYLDTLALASGEKSFHFFDIHRFLTGYKSFEPLKMIFDYILIGPIDGKFEQVYNPQVAGLAQKIMEDLQRKHNHSEQIYFHDPENRNLTYILIPTSAL